MEVIWGIVPKILFDAELTTGQVSYREVPVLDFVQVGIEIVFGMLWLFRQAVVGVGERLPSTVGGRRSAGAVSRDCGLQTVPAWTLG